MYPFSNYWNFYTCKKCAMMTYAGRHGIKFFFLEDRYQVTCEGIMCCTYTTYVFSFNLWQRGASFGFVNVCKAIHRNVEMAN